MCKTNDLNTVLWTVTGNRCHVPPKLVLFSLQQETCFMQNLQHATASLTAVDSWALGQNSLGEKGNRFVAETEIYVCLVKSSFKLQTDHESSFRDYVLTNQLHRPWPIMIFLWILMCTHIHKDTTCPHFRMNWHCRTTEKTRKILLLWFKKYNVPFSCQWNFALGTKPDNIQCALLLTVLVRHHKIVFFN